MQRLDLFYPPNPDDEVESPPAFLQAVRQHGIEVIKTPPSSNRDYPASVRRSPRFGIDSDDDHNTECESTGRRWGAAPPPASPDRFLTARRGQGTTTGERLFISDTTSVSEGPTPSTTARGVQSQQAWQDLLLQTVGTVQEDEQGNDDEHDSDEEPIPSLSISSVSPESLARSNCERLAMDVDHMLTRRSADGGLSMMIPLPGTVLRTQLSRTLESSPPSEGGRDGSSPMTFHHRSSMHQGGGVGIVTTSDSDSLAYSEEPVTLDDVQPSPQVRLNWPDSVLAELSDRLKDEMQADDDFDLDPPTDADHLKSPQPLAEPRPEPDVPHAASPMTEENHHASRVTTRQPESDHSPTHEWSPQDHHSATSAADDGSPHDKTPNTASDTVTPVSRRMLWWIRSTPVSPYHGGSTRDTTYRQQDKATRPFFPSMRSEAGAKKRRRRRVMLFACGGVMVLLLTLALVGIYGILPGVVQRSLDKSSLVLDAIYISNPSLSGKGGYGFDLAVSGSMQRPEGLARSVRVTTKPFRLEMYGVVSENHSPPMIPDNSTNRSGIHAVFEGLGGSSSSDLPMGSFEAPPMVLEGSPAPLTLECRVRVDDSTSFDAFTYLLTARPGEQAGRDGLGWRFVGSEGLDIKVELPFGAIDLPFHINSLKYERYLPNDAMGGSLGAALAADGVEVSDLELKGKDDIGKGVDLSLTVVFHNPSKLSIETLGDVHLALAYKGLPIGELVASSASLESGRNTWRLEGRLEPASRLADGTDGRALMSEMVTAILKQEKPVVAAKGKRSSLPIFSSAVRALDLTLPFSFGTSDLLQAGATDANATARAALVRQVTLVSFNLDLGSVMGVRRVLSGRRLQAATLPVSGQLEASVSNVFGSEVPFNVTSIAISTFLEPASMAVRPFGAPTAAAAAAAAAGGLAIRLSEVDFTGAVAGGGLGVKTVALVDNPSLAQVTLGDVAFVLTLPATTEGEAPVVLGSVGGKGVHLPSGRSKIHLTGQLRPDEADMAAVSSAFSSYIQGGGLPVDIRVTGAGNTTLPRWLETLTANFDLNASLPPLHTLSGVTTGAGGAVGGEFALIEQMEVTAFELDLSNTTATEKRIGVTGGLRATLRNPLGASAPITVDRLSLASDLHRVENDTQWGERFGHLEVPQDNLVITPADGNGTGLIDLTLKLTGVVELLDGGKPFTEFARRLLDADTEADADTSVAGSLSMGLRGEMVSAVGTPMGMLTLSGLPLSETVDFRSLGSLRDRVNLTHWSIEGVDEAANGTAPKLHLAATVELKNPSFLGLSLGDVMWTLSRLDESRRGARIGRLVSSNLTIQPKPAVTTIGLLGSLEPPDGKAAGDFFSEVLNDMILSDTPNPVMVRPSPMGRGAPWLSEVMGSMEMQLSLGGLFADSLLQSITLERLHFAPNADGTVELKGSLMLAARNPFTKVGDVSIDTISMTAQLVDSKSRPVGRLTIPTQPAQRIEPDDTSNGTTNATDSLRARFVFRSSLTIDENSAAIVDLVSALTATDPLPSSALRLQLVGSSNVSVETPLGLIEIRDLPLAVDDPLPLTDGDEPAFDLASAKLGSIAFGSEPGEEGVAFTTDLSVSVPPDFPLSVDLGNVVFALKYPAGGANESITLGELAVEPLRIRAGNNSLPVRGRLLPPDPEDPNAMLQASDFISTYLSGQNATVRVQGVSITIPGAETAPSWLGKTVKAIAVDITLPGRPQQTLQELRIADVSLGAANNATAGATFSASVRGGFTNPLGEGSEVIIKRARVDVAMRRPGAADDETPLGTLTTPFMAVKTSVDEGSPQRSISLELQDGMIVFPDGGERLGNLAADLLRSGDDENLTSSTDDGPTRAAQDTDEPEAEQRVVVGGWVEAEVDSPLGELTLRLPVETDVTIGGISLGNQGGAGGLREWSVRDAANVDEGFDMEAAFDVVIGGDGDGSLASIELGGIELEVWYDGGRLAELVAPDVTLKRGANRLMVRGVIREGITDRDAASAFLSAMVDSRPLPVTIKGKKAVDGEERSWVLMAMEALSLDVELSPSRGDVAEGEGEGKGAGVGAVGVESGEFIGNVAIDSLMFDFTTSAGGGGGGDGGGPVLQGNVEVVYQLPEAFDVTHTVIELNQTVELRRVKDSSLEPPLGRVSLSTTSVSPLTPSAEAFPAHNASRLRAFRASFADATLQTEEGEERERFEAFLVSLVAESGPSVMELSGRASLAVQTAVGELEVREVDLTLRRDIEHIGGTLADRSGVFGTEVTGGTADALIIETVLWIAHQGFLSARLGDVDLDLYLPTNRSLRSSLPDSMTILDETDGGDTILVKVGEVTIPDLALVNGENHTMPIQVRIDPAPGPDLRAGSRVFLSRFVSQLPNDLEVRGRRDSSRNPLLKALFGAWKSRMTIPGSSNKLMQAVELDDLRGIPLINMRILVRLTLRNAFPVDMAIRHNNLTVYNDGTLIASGVVDWRDDPSVIRAESTSNTRWYTLNTFISKAAIRTVLRSLVGRAYVESSGTVEFSVGNYIAYLDYDEKDIPTTCESLCV
ncbi:unnamed protein product [Vitrella brassicaformis CCMP3155]|uniref:Uncharacterized protein n=1 Tax=Vitrella brassicaformis (strain CCMP3155) TaxID=1169540 RepID=A0A0G4F6G1_VITBC|nr:unnamed protein product [Vitrella brassicaformis CCMP3155]|eukprot:CEM07615.1 unnamed protein product [Vitrella brassicaformis CCMP3155]